MDYLSTVSGGGYAGAYLSTEVLRSKPVPAENGTGPRLPFDPNQTAFSNAGDGTQSRNPDEPALGAEPVNSPFNVSHFIYGGRYLFKPWDFSSQHLIGWVLVFGTVCTGVLALAALVAWLFRLLDLPVVRRWLDQLGFADDLHVAFFPSFVLLLIWLLMWIGSYWKDKSRARGELARYVFYALVIVTAVACAGLMGTGHISFVQVTTTSASGGSDSEHASFNALSGAGQVKLTEASPKQNTINAVKDKLIYVVFSVWVASLLPYLSPKKLFSISTSRESSTFDKAVYGIATRALVFGVPFAAVAWFASENISRINDTRNATFMRFSELADWNDAGAPFWERLVAESAVDFSPSKGIIQRLDDPRNCICLKPFEGAKSTSQGHTPKENTKSIVLLRDLKSLAESFRKADDDLNVREAWWLFLTSPIRIIWEPESDPNKLRRYVNVRGEFEENQDYVVCRLNRALGDPSLYEVFETGSPNAGAGVQTAQANSLREEVQRRLQQEDVQKLASEARRLNEWLLRFGLAKYSNSNSDRKVSEADLKTAFPNQSHAYSKWCRDIVNVNRRLMEAYYGNDAIRPKAEFVSSYVVIEADQSRRLQLFIWCFCGFVLLCAVVDLNATSWHGFYSDQIATMWMQSVPDLDRQIPLACLDTAKNGGPYHVISGTVQKIGWGDRADESLSQDHFLFSKRYFGSTRTGYAETGKYDDANLTLANAVAISAATVTPAQVSNPLLRALLFLGNIRLGQWVANPGHHSVLPARWQKLAQRAPVTPLRILSRLWQSTDRRPFCFVTDGGHYESLGVEALLRRRCRLIIVADASQDGRYGFAGFDKLIRWARLNHGIEFVSVDYPNEPVGLDTLVPNEAHEPSASDDITIGDAKMQGEPRETTRSKAAEKLRKERLYSQSHFVIAEIRYPEPKLQLRGKSYLVYLKSTLTGDEPRDIIGFADANHNFPHDLTSEQAFEPDRFEAYRQLGKHVAETMIAELFANPADLQNGPSELLDCLERKSHTCSSAAQVSPPGRVPDAATDSSHG